MVKIGHVPLCNMGQWRRGPVPVMGLFPPSWWRTIVIANWRFIPMLWVVPPWGLRTTVPGHPWDSFHPTRGRATLVHITWGLFMDCGPHMIQGIFLWGWSWNLSPSGGPIGMGCRSRVEVGRVHLLGPYFRAIGS